MKKKEYQELIRVSKSKYIDQWIKRGYMPGVVLTPDGDAEIPEDMPRPYKSNGKTKKISKLAEEIIKAADMQQSVYPQMFPMIREDTFKRTVLHLIDCHIILPCRSSTGAPFFELLPYWKNFGRQEQSGIIQAISDGVGAASGSFQIIQSIILLIPTLADFFTGFLSKV